MSITPEETEPQLLNVNTFCDVDRLKLMMETYKKTGMKESGLKNILQRYLVLIEVIVDKHNMEIKHPELHGHYMHAQRKAKKMLKEVRQDAAYVQQQTMVERSTSTDNPRLRDVQAIYKDTNLLKKITFMAEHPNEAKRQYSLTQSDIALQIKDYIIMQILQANGHRSMVAGGMTKAEYDSRVKNDTGAACITVLRHKTAKFYAARVFLQPEIAHIFELYMTKFRTEWGKAFKASRIDDAINMLPSDASKAEHDQAAAAAITPFKLRHELAAPFVIFLINPWFCLNTGCQKIF